MSPRRTPLIGFRDWRVRVEPLRLTGVIHAVGWPLDDVVATCRVVEGLHSWDALHGAPRADCTCGLYGRHELAEVPKAIPLAHHIYGVRVIGAVVGWGRMVIHERGWRAEFAKPVALAYGPSDLRRITADLADEYGIPVVAASELQWVAAEFGERYVREAQA